MSVIIRLMNAEDVIPADQVFRLAFGKFVGLPNPMDFCGDATDIPHRWKTNPEGAFVAEEHGEIVGSNLATRWGSFAFFGPLTVRPDYWNQKVAQQLIEPILQCYEQWNIQLAGLYTFSASPKHHALYQKFGFRLRFLSVIMAKKVKSTTLITIEKNTVEENTIEHQFSQFTESQQSEFLTASRELTHSVYSGLDLTSEIEAVRDLKLGETIALWSDRGLAGFAVCHVGANTEAGSDTCYLKFAIARSESDFNQLLDLCEAFAAYQRMLARGFRTELTGVAMHRPNDPGFSRPDVFVVDDWR